MLAHAQVPVSSTAARRRPPAQQRPLGGVEQPVGGMNDEGGGEDRGEHRGGVEVHRAGLHQIAEPAIGRDQLGDDRAADGVGHRDAKPGEDMRHGGGKDDVARDMALARAGDLRHLHQPRIERAHARQRVEIDDEEHDARHQRDLGFDADAEPENEQRREGELGRAVAADHERIENGDDHRVAPQQERQQHRRHPADDRADQRLLDGVAALHDQFAVEDLRGEARGHRAGRAQPVGTDENATDLPCRQDDGEHDQPVGVGAPSRHGASRYRSEASLDRLTYPRISFGARSSNTGIALQLLRISVISSNSAAQRDRPPTRRNRSLMARLVAVAMFSPVSCAKFRAKRSVSGSLMLGAMARVPWFVFRYLLPGLTVKMYRPEAGWGFITINGGLGSIFFIGPD